MRSRKKKNRWRQKCEVCLKRRAKHCVRQTGGKREKPTDDA